MHGNDNSEAHYNQLKMLFNVNVMMLTIYVYIIMTVDRAAANGYLHRLIC